MTEVTIKDILGYQKKNNKSLIGCRVSVLEIEKRKYPSYAYSITIDYVVSTNKKSRMRKEIYKNRYLNMVLLEDIETDDFEED